MENFDVIGPINDHNRLANLYRSVKTVSLEYCWTNTARLAGFRGSV